MEPAKEQIKGRSVEAGEVLESDLQDADIGSQWGHERTGLNYTIEELVMVKDPEDARWYQGVKYKPVASSSGLCYVRYEADFLRKFRRA